MKIIDNISRLLGNDLKETLRPGAKLKIAASCFSMYAYEALKDELERIEGLDFVFTAPAFVADEVTDKIRKERREFHIPKPRQRVPPPQSSGRRRSTALRRYPSPGPPCTMEPDSGATFRDHEQLTRTPNQPSSR
jgi:hypothetical protein